MVESREGPLTDRQKRIVRLEAFVDGTYRDTVRSKQHPKGVLTGGVGQTGPWINKTFKQAFAAKEKSARGYVKNYDSLPPHVQTELLQAHYRGDLVHGKDFRKLLNAGKYKEASAEFLDHDEYRTTQYEQIRNRMQAVSAAVASMQP